MKILNLYAGIGGNRKLWGEDHEITAVELNPEIAAIYKDFFPNDTVLIEDAHEYLLKHFQEYDFIWSSPPCPTHSRLGILNYNLGGDLKYPDMKLYQEIIILQNIFNGKWVVENVKSYYFPLIRPMESGRHYFWSNFRIGNLEVRGMSIKGKTGLTAEKRMKDKNINIIDWHNFKGDKRVLFKNCVNDKLGVYILNCAMNIITSENVKQIELF
jgi:DNA (cytosine-5)-methyltransferase 1